MGVITDRTGALLVADDVGNVIWRVGRQADQRYQPAVACEWRLSTADGSSDGAV